PVYQPIRLHAIEYCPELCNPMSKWFQTGRQIPSASAGRSGLDRRRLMSLAGASAAMLAAPRVVLAQSYPVRPVRAIVTFAPGGTVDIYARLACQHLSQK